ncbi:hypothetical protein [Streptomyces sp. RFCAC02]|uniref:hypothetical protein n=1 Tax=Streptomyces sp. RFCAC02 TaxID=2499143 RepID=UPI0010207095|nr:hypothetical protein [Streptomyces sp. RFCAC02]
MRWLRRFGFMAAAVAAVVFGMGGQANAAVPPKNSGWVYTLSGSGATFFDADLAGYPSYEKYTVCDNTSDGRGIIATFVGTSPSGYAIDRELRDPSNNGDCAAASGNFFADGYYVYITVCEYYGDNYVNCRQGTGVA